MNNQPKSTRVRIHSHITQSRFLHVDVVAKRPFTSRKSGRVTVSEEGTFQVEETGDIPPFTAALPQGELIAAIVVSAENLKQAAAGQEGFVRLSLYGSSQALELSSAGKYALVMPITDVQEW